MLKIHFFSWISLVVSKEWLLEPLSGEKSKSNLSMQPIVMMECHSLILSVVKAKGTGLGKLILWAVARVMWLILAVLPSFNIPCNDAKWPSGT